MKIGLISDIHGNYEALKVVLGELDSLGVERIYCAGDVVGYYCQINECCDELRRRRIQCVMGNHDWYMVGGGYCPRSQSVNDCLVYQREIITEDNLAWLKTFPVQLEINNIQIVHGGWADPIDEYVKPTKKYFENISGEIFVSGHTHVQTLKFFGEKIYCNPGSVGQPRDNDPRAAFAVIDGSEVTLHRVEYVPDKLFDLMAKAGFNDYYYGGLLTGSRYLQRP